MWIFASTTQEALPGIGYEPLTDAEFEAAVERYEAQFDAAQRGAVKRSGLYRHVKDKPEAKAGDGGEE